MTQLFFSSLNLEELKSEISQAIIEEISPKLLAIQSPKPDFQLLTRKEASALLGISLPTLLDWTKSGKVQGYRIASRVRYKRSELEEALQRIKYSK